MLRTLVKLRLRKALRQRTRLPGTGAQVPPSSVATLKLVEASAMSLACMVDRPLQRKRRQLTPSKFSAHLSVTVCVDSLLIAVPRLRQSLLLTWRWRVLLHQWALPTWPLGCLPGLLHV